MNEVRLSAIYELSNSMGLDEVMKLKNLNACIIEGLWERAANTLLCTKWAKSNGAKAIAISEKLRKG